MRINPLYNKAISVTSIKSLAEKYNINGTVGDQDWLTTLGWELPELFYILPCEFNVQMDQVYNTIEYQDTWEDYHQCKPRTKIIHRNGE